MRFFKPIVVYAQSVDSDGAAAERFGGLPAGIDTEQWPRCSECGGPMSHICQFRHDVSRLDLGAEGRVLRMWQCENNPGLCETWSATSGANAVTISDPPEEWVVIDPPNPETMVYAAAQISEWVEGEDGVPENRYLSYFSDEQYFAMGEEGLAGSGFETRLGGVPAWIQSAEEGPEHPWRFSGQVAPDQKMTGPVPPLGTSGLGIQRKTAEGWAMERPPNVEPAHWIVVDETDWYLGGPNFAGGMAYLFLNAEADPPRAVFFWQR